MDDAVTQAGRQDAIPGYDEQIVRWFTLATVIWAIVGLSAGLLVALQLTFPSLNFSEYATFGRLRPVHVSGVSVRSKPLSAMASFGMRVAAPE